MEYPVNNANDWNSVGRLSAWNRLRLLFRNRRYRRRAVSREGVTIDKIHSATNPVGQEDVILICAARDAEKYIPSLLTHYRGLGVTRFAFVDDASTDQTRELLKQPDVDLYTSNIGYKRACGGLLWRDMLVELYGYDRWYISIDSDEYLIYPGYENRPISAFIHDLARHGRKRSLAVMLDIYPDKPLSDAPPHEPSDALPTVCCPLHDGNGYSVFDDVHSTAIRGGPRLRMFGANMRMSKFPVIYVDKRTRFNGASPHAPVPLERNFGPVLAVLLHYKFSTDAVKDFQRIVAHGSYADGSRFYKSIIAHETFGENMDLRYADSVRFTDLEGLVTNGYIKDIRQTVQK